MCKPSQCDSPFECPLHTFSYRHSYLEVWSFGSFSTAHLCLSPRATAYVIYGSESVELSAVAVKFNTDLIENEWFPIFHSEQTVA